MQKGHAADVVILDSKQVSERATFKNPHAYADGIPYVLVNGIFVVREGRHTGARPGQVLRSRSPFSGRDRANERASPDTETVAPGLCARIPYQWVREGGTDS